MIDTAILVFVFILGTAIYLFTYHVRQIRRLIRMGKSEDRTDRPALRWLQMFKIAVFQAKMFDRPVAAIFHLFIYVGFFVVNIEILEIVWDGLTGLHRAFAPHLGGVYNVITAASEIFLVLVLVSAVIFLIRRNILRLPRFAHKDLKGWPWLDANIILWTEVILVLALLTMNASDIALQEKKIPPYIRVGYFPVSQFLAPLFDNMHVLNVIGIERTAWWVHIIAVLAFLNYIPFSKHLHIFLSFPNVYYADLDKKAYIPVSQAILAEVKSLLGLAESQSSSEMPTLGAKDITDLSWKNLLDAFTCTECGRCSSVCPANQTGRLLSPRRIMMATRDRMEEIAAHLREHGSWEPDGKNLWNYISAEEIWACTTCAACVEACPVGINPLSIILQMRQNATMEASTAPAALNSMFAAMENNQAPWQFPPSERVSWTTQV
ncbi:MAG: 4Fe-4S dicluster domain-containing protein [Bacteroidia bacterium]